MYSSEELVKKTTRFASLQNAIITEMEVYGAQCWEKYNTVIPRYHGLLFNFAINRYDYYIIERFPLSSEEDYKIAYINLCRSVYQYSCPVIFSSLVCPIEIEIEENEVIRNERGMLMFSQTQILTKYGIYQMKDGKMTLNRKLTRNFWPKPYMMNMGYIVGSLPSTS